MKDQEMTLGQKVKEARINKKMTQKDLAGDFITRNMLSQIENDIATPSIKTIEHIANTLSMPISFFVDQNTHRIPETEIVEEIMSYYDEKSYLVCIEKLDGYFENHPEASTKPFLKNIYINCCMLAGRNAKSQEDYNECKVLYEKILKYETDLMFDENAMLYNVYSELSEVSARGHIVEDSKKYDEKASGIVNKMIANQVIQRMYIDFVEGSYDAVISKMSSLDIRELDNYNKGRYFMMIGSAYYYQSEYELAIRYLEKAIPYYKMGTYNSIITMIYDDLSKCYSNLDDYKKAYEYLQKSKEGNTH